MGNPNVTTLAPGGATIPRTPEDAAALGATVQDPAFAHAEQSTARRRAMFDTPGDKLDTFGEGIVDGFLLGFVHETGEAADLRRDVNSGYAFLGEGVGTAAGLLTGVGPVKALAETGEAAGRLAARAALRQGEKSIITTALKEAGAGAALSGAASFGHQFLDTVIEDKPFSGEAILDNAKLGGIIGGAGGGLVGVFGKVASRAEVAAQGGLVADLPGALESVESARAAYGEALWTHEAQLGAMKEWRRLGKLTDVSDDFIRVREAAIRDARAEQAALKELDAEAALSGRDPAAYKEFQRRFTAYERAMQSVDEIMQAHPAELGGVRARALDEQGGTGIHNRTMELSDSQVVRDPTMELSASQIVPETVNPVRGGEDFAVPASRVAEAIPDEAGYLARYKSRNPEAVPQPAQMPEGTPAFRPSRDWQVVPDGAVMPPGGEYRMNLQGANEARWPGMAPEGTVAGKRAAMPAVQDVVGAEGVPVSPDVNGANFHTVAENPKFWPSTTDFLKENPKNIPGEIERMFRKRSKAEAIEAANKTKVAPEAAPVPDQATQVREALTLKPEAPDVAQGMMDAWAETARPGEGRVRPWHQAQTKATAAMEALYQKAGGRFDSARSLGMLEADGIKPATTGLGSYLDSVYSMNRAVHLAAKEARGVATPLRGAMAKAVMGALGNRVSRALLGNKLGGPLGAILGFTQYGGKLAAASGRLAQQVTDSVAKFLTTTKVRAVASAAANTAWTYSDRGPLKDPVERIQEVQFLAANPDAIRARVAEHAGELSMVAPEQVKALADRAVAQVQAIAVRAPAIYFDRLGRPLAPPQGKLRQFFEFENAVNDLQPVLSSLQRGAITKPQADALQLAWPSVHLRITQEMLSNPEKLATFDRAKLRIIEMVTGMSLTGATDPAFLLRQQAAWIPPAPPQEPQRPQAFNINPAGAPTPSQANASGRAPGN